MVLTSISVSSFWKTCCLSGLIGMWLGISTVHAQSSAYLWAEIDQRSRSLPDSIEQDIPAIAQFLTDGLESDKEKIRSIYSWVIHHIRFDNRAYKNGNKRLNRHVADVLRRRKAVCFGYAQLIEQLCKEAGIPSALISGYAKTQMSNSIQLKAINHAWNAVQLSGEWFLLDASWGSSLQYMNHEMSRLFQEDYFLTSPAHFVRNHLPADPQWQLLSYPLSAKAFSQPTNKQLAIDSSHFFNFRDSLINYFQHTSIQRKLITTQHAYSFHPTSSNRRELAAVYMDQETYLTYAAERFQENQQFDSLLIIRQQMIQLCELAEQLGDLFESQQENCAYNRINLAIALTNQQQREEKTDKAFVSVDQRKQLLQDAMNILKGLPENNRIQAALEQCRQQLKLIED